MEKSKTSFLMYESAVKIARQLPDKYGYKFLLSICDFGLYGTEPDFSNCGQYALAMTLGFTPLRPAIENSKKRYENCVNNGKKGGAPKGNKNAKKQPKNNQENNQENNLTDTDTVTDTVSLQLSVSEDTDNCYAKTNIKQPPKAGGGYPAPAPAVNKLLEELTKEERAALLPTLI